MSSHGRGCECGAGRGFRSEGMAHTVYWAMTQHLGLTTAPEFYQCAHGKHHWETAALNRA